MTVASLVDTNILVYRFDARFPRKQQIVTELLWLVPKLRLGNPMREAPASRLHHQARITSMWQPVVYRLGQEVWFGHVSWRTR